MSNIVKKILYATDMSANSGYALEFAVDYAKSANAKIVLIHTVEPLSPSMMVQLQAHLSAETLKLKAQESLAYAQGEIHKRLDAFFGQFFPNQPDARNLIESVKVIEGYPADQILEQAEQCDMIIMGTHGKDNLANTFLGSTAERVLHRTRKPVLIVPLPKAKA